jgi:hypothetical protein
MLRYHYAIIIASKVFFLGSFFYLVAALTRRLIVIYLQGVAFHRLFIGFVSVLQTRTLNPFWASVLDPVGLILSRPSSLPVRGCGNSLRLPASTSSTSSVKFTSEETGTGSIYGFGRQPGHKSGNVIGALLLRTYFFNPTPYQEIDSIVR